MSISRWIIPIATVLSVLAVRAQQLPATSYPAFSQIPMVRVTDIQAVETDPAGNRFRLQLEFLNWTHLPASGILLALNTSTVGAAPGGPALAGAAVNPGGRPLTPRDVTFDGAIRLDLPASNPASDLEDLNGNGRLDPGEDKNGDLRLTNDPIPGNRPQFNTWAVGGATATAVHWLAGVPIPARNLAGQASAASMCGLVPGCVLSGGVPSVANLERVDDGDNVLDGFVVEVDQWRVGETVSVNWFLENAGAPVGSAGSGNPFGFGVLSLVRLRYPYSSTLPSGLFAGSTRYQRQAPLFYDNVSFVPLPALFGAEFNRALTAPFLNRADQPGGANPNTSVDITDGLGLLTLVYPPSGSVGAGGIYPVTATFQNKLRGGLEQLCFLVTELSGGAVRVEVPQTGPPNVQQDGAGAVQCVPGGIAVGQRFPVVFPVRLANPGPPAPFRFFVNPRLAPGFYRMTLTPATDERPINTPLLLTVKITDANGQPVSGVTFSVAVTATDMAGRPLVGHSFSVPGTTGAAGTAIIRIDSIVVSRFEMRGDFVDMKGNITRSAPAWVTWTRLNQPEKITLLPPAPPAVRIGTKVPITAVVKDENLTPLQGYSVTLVVKIFDDVNLNAVSTERAFPSTDAAGMAEFRFQSGKAGRYEIHAEFEDRFLAARTSDNVVTIRWLR